MKTDDQEMMAVEVGVPHEAAESAPDVAESGAGEQEEMPDHEYQAIQQKLTLMGGLLQDMDLEAFIRKIDICNTVGPLFDPTLWMKGHRRLEHVRKLAVAANKMKAAYAGLVEQVQKEEDRR